MFIVVTRFGGENENRIDSLHDRNSEGDPIATLAEANEILEALPEGKYPQAFACEAPAAGGCQDWLVDPVAETVSFLPDVTAYLNKRLNDVAELFAQKIGAGFVFDHPQGQPQTFAYTDSGLRWLDRAALRARKSKDNNENRTFKMRVVGGKITLTDIELIDVASDYYDAGTLLDDVAQDYYDALRAIAEGAGTDAAKYIALRDHDITAGW